MKFYPFLMLFAVCAGRLLAQDVDQAEKTVSATIAVADFQNRHPFLEQDWIGAALPDLIGSGLARATQAGASGVQVLDRSAIASLETESRLAGDGAAVRGAVATHVIGGSFNVADGTVQFDVALTAIGQAPTWTQRFSGPVASLQRLAQEAARNALASLDAPVGEAPERNRDLPMTALVTFYRGSNAVRRGDHARALADLLRTCKQAPDFGQAWLLLGTTLEALGRPAAAMAAWEQALAVDPDDPAMPATLWRLALAHESKPDRALSRQLYQRLIDDFPYSRAPTGTATTRDATYAQLATQRLATLAPSSTPAPGAPTGQGVDPVASGRRSADLTATDSPRASLLEARLRQYLLLENARSRDEFVDSDREYFLRQAMFAAGGWPDQLPAVRLREGVPVNLPSGKHVVLPPPGQVIERLSLEVVGTNAAQEGFRLSAADPCDGGSDGEMMVQGDGQANLVLDARHAAGFFGTIRFKTSRQGAAAGPELRLTATLRPSRPGSLWIITQPPGASIQVAGMPRGISPCLISDLPPGEVAITAEVRFSPDVGSPEENSRYLHFQDQATVRIADAGETRMEWTLAHRPEASSAAWTPLSLITPASLDALPPIEVPIGWFPPARPCVVAHPRLGWLAAWTAGQDIALTSSTDGRTWKPPLPVLSGHGDELRAMTLAPNGRTLLVFMRDNSVHATMSDDLTAWSPASVILAGQPEETVRVLGARCDAAGRWQVLVQQHARIERLATSSDARSWQVEQISPEKPPEWSYEDGVSLFDAFADGSPALLSISGDKLGILRFGLDQTQHWVLRDQSPTLDRARLYAAAARIHAVGDQHYEIITADGTGTRWQVGKPPQSVDGLHVSGRRVATAHGPKGTLLLIPVAESWWVAGDPATMPPPAPSAPLVSYEKPMVNHAPIIVAAPATAPADLSPSMVPPPAPTAASAIPTSPVAPAPANRGSGTVLISSVIAALVILAAGSLWWWRRRQEVQS